MPYSDCCWGCSGLDRWNGTERNENNLQQLRPLPSVQSCFSLQLHSSKRGEGRGKQRLHTILSTDSIDQILTAAQVTCWDAVDRQSKQNNFEGILGNHQPIATEFPNEPCYGDRKNTSGGKEPCVDSDAIGLPSLFPLLGRPFGRSIEQDRFGNYSFFVLLRRRRVLPVPTRVEKVWRGKIHIDWRVYCWFHFTTPNQRNNHQHDVDSTHPRARALLGL